MFTRYFVPIDKSTEYCYYIEHTCSIDDTISTLTRVFGKLQVDSQFSSTFELFEYGPKLNFKTSWCSNVLTILEKCGITGIDRIERSIRSVNEIEYDPMTQTRYLEPLTSFTHDNEPEPVRTVPKSEIEQYSRDHSLGFDAADIDFYCREVFPDRDPTNVELYDLAQSNSEHCRHHFFSGKHIIDGEEKADTLFDLIKGTLPGSENSVSAFCDNASAIRGYRVERLRVNSDKRYEMYPDVQHFTFTAETHNFPTGVAPFPGAATGVGGRVRDTLAIGRGGTLVAGTAGYCVADRKLLIEASNGASDYGNKLGEPIIQGFTRYFDQMVNGQRWAWIKPIMFSGGIGTVLDRDLKKELPRPGLKIVRVGGPAYRIGIGGGTASSTHQSGISESSQSDTKCRFLNAVQRGDPEMENRVYKFIRACTEMSFNPILSIHDQGAGGTANVTKEIVEPTGGVVDINKIISGDPTLSTLEKWIAEYQEQMTFLADEKDLPFLEEIAQRENVPLVVFGETTNTGRMIVKDHEQDVVNLDLQKIFNTPQKTWIDNTTSLDLLPTETKSVKEVLSLESVGSKRFLTTKVDRSVGGLVAQQQGVGPFDTPVSDYAVVSASFEAVENSFRGAATAIGEQPIKAFICPKTAAQLAVTEMMLNLCFVKISKRQDIKCSVNWMWPAKLFGENAAMYQAMEALSAFMRKLGISADGGKDSVSMYTKCSQNEIIKSPRSVVVSGYVTVPDITVKVTPDFKRGGSQIVYIPVNFPEAHSVCRVFETVQELLGTGKILAGHDVSDGGLITTIVEMAISGNRGATLELWDTELLFSEQPGVVLEINDMIDDVPHYKLGYTTDTDQCSIMHRGRVILNETIHELRTWWEAPSSSLDRLQANPVTVDQEAAYLSIGKYPKVDTPELPYRQREGPINVAVGIVSDEGSNGEREMAAAFYHAGFTVLDLKTVDLLKDPGLLDGLSGIAFVGGFTYADVAGAAQGWATVIKSNPRLLAALEHFRDRENTFSLGVCNGCQLMSKINFIPTCRFESNISGRFESRFSVVKIGKTPSIMLKGMESWALGVWVAHAEGRFIGDVPEQQTPIKYVDVNGLPTEEYPCNPNGSLQGTAAVCSADGRHLAMMPHPERCFLNWQIPRGFTQAPYAPWFKLFANAFEWVTDITNNS